VAICSSFRCVIGFLPRHHPTSYCATPLFPNSVVSLLYLLPSFSTPGCKCNHSCGFAIAVQSLPCFMHIGCDATNFRFLNIPQQHWYLFLAPLIWWPPAPPVTLAGPARLRQPVQPPALTTYLCLHHGKAASSPPISCLDLLVITSPW
jgi:hypothetical protein